MDNVELFLAKWGGIIASVVFIARIIVKLTPTPKDDSVLQWVIDVLRHIGLAMPVEDKGLKPTDNAGVLPGGVQKP